MLSKPTHLGEPAKRIINGPNSLLERLFKSPPNRHNLTDTLHTTAQQPAHPIELLQVPSRNLDNDIVERGFEARRSDFGNRVLDLVQGDSEAELGSDESEGVTGGLGSERGGTRETSVDLE